MPTGDAGRRSHRLHIYDAVKQLSYPIRRAQLACFSITVIFTGFFGIDDFENAELIEQQQAFYRRKHVSVLPQLSDSRWRMPYEHAAGVSCKRHNHYVLLFTQ